jgi:hypothetical protein
MSEKNVTVKKNGVAQTFNNTFVIGTRTDRGSGDWIPEEDAKTAIKHITLNGQYIARSRDNVMGYTAVFVNVPLRSITGVDPNDGNTYKVRIDGQGNIRKTRVN